MNVQLRNSNGFPRRRFGMGVDPGLNVTTMWTPSGGFDFNSPGASSGPAVYQAPTVIPPPACSQDTQPGGTAFSSACIDQLLKTQQANMQLATNANYAVDLQNCLNTYPQPPDCYQRTFGLTLPNSTGGTNVDMPNAPQLLGDPAAQALAAEAAPHANAPPAPHPPTPPPTQAATPPASTSPGTSTAQKVSDALTGGKTSTPSTPSDNSTLYWIVGLAAAATLIYAAVNR
jgi:hypothetical protein